MTPLILRCFVCSGEIPAQPSEHTKVFIDTLQSLGLAFLVCRKCFDTMLTEGVKKERVFITDNNTGKTYPLGSHPALGDTTLA